MLATLIQRLRMSADSSLATVTDLTEIIADARDREEFAWLFHQLTGLRAALFEPPATLLPEVFDQIDRVDRFGWTRAGGPRWMAYAGGIAASAAGALVLANRTRRAN